MSAKSRANGLQDALENLVRNLERLPLAEVQGRIRQIAKQAIVDADAAESVGRAEEAVALYRIAALAYRRLAELASGDSRASELAMAEYWEERAELAENRVRFSSEEPSQSSSKQSAIHTPKPTPIPPKSSIERGQMGKPPGFAVGDSRKAQRFERSPQKRVEELDRQANDRSSFRKPK